jgi:hypothetical protein
MTVQVLDEIPVSEFQHMEIDTLAAMVRDRIACHVKEHKNR